jgi:hypothetical protein
MKDPIDAVSSVNEYAELRPDSLLLFKGALKISIFDQPDTPINQESNLAEGNMEIPSVLRD